jgi:hypothetical protein
MIQQPQVIALIDLTIFQALWWLAALEMNNAILGLVALLSLHFVVLNQHLKRDLLVVSLFAPLGWAIDLALQALGFWDLQSDYPVWLLAIWAGFILNLLYSLDWLAKLSRLLQSLIGGLAGSLSYLAGAKLGAINFNYPLASSTFSLFIVWSLLLPSILLSLNFFIIRTNFKQKIK